jgi:hypothetical protein
MARRGDLRVARWRLPSRDGLRSHRSFLSDAPGMHTSDTIDYGIVIRGEGRAASLAEIIVCCDVRYTLHDRTPAIPVV